MLFLSLQYFSGWSDIFAQIGAILNTLLVIGLGFFYRLYLQDIEKQKKNRTVNQTP